MKNILFTITFLVSFLFLFQSTISAQISPNLYVAPYITAQDLNYVFENSTKILDYIDGDDIEQPVIVFSATDDQYEVLRSKGIRPELIEEQADLSHYVYVYHPASNKAPLLSNYGTVYAITSHHALLKISNPDTFEFKGELVQFSRLPLGQNVEKPAGVSTSSPATLDLQNVKWAPAPFSWKNLFGLLTPLIIGIIIIAGVAWYTLKRRKKNSD